MKFNISVPINILDIIKLFEGLTKFYVQLKSVVYLARFTK